MKPDSVPASARNLYSIRDNKVGEFAPLFQMRNDAEAIRSFGDLAHDPKSMISHHPEDYTLYFIGYYDVETGTLISCQPVALATASDFIQENK